MLQLFEKATVLMCNMISTACMKQHVIVWQISGLCPGYLIILSNVIFPKTFHSVAHSMLYAAN